MAQLTLQQALNLAMAHHASGRLKEAETLYRQILAADPGNPDVVHMLGTLAYHAGQYNHALALMEQAIAVRPQAAHYHCNLAPVLIATGRLPDAADACRRAIALDPVIPGAHYNLGLACQLQRHYEASIAAYLEALQLNPGHTLARLNLGNVYRTCRRFDDAVAEYQLIIDANPRAAADAYHNLALALKELDRLDDAETACRRALEQSPNDPDTLNNLGNILKDLGLLDEAIAAFRRALEIRPGYSSVHSNLIFAMQFHPRQDLADPNAEGRAWNALHGRPSPRPPLKNNPNPDRVLRIGYVSPHFYLQAIAHFALSLLRAHDRSQFEIHCYSSVVRPDATTILFQESGVVWHDVHGMSDQALAAQVASDHIDILVDLTMHMEGSRLGMFALQPAPVQVTWVAYPGGTGLDAMHYRISDIHMDPFPENDTLFAEETIRLNQWVAYSPITELPPVNALPALENGYLTFGCLNNVCKINADVLDLWARVLTTLPTARLLLRAPSGSTRRRLLESFRSRGVSAERIDFVGWQSRFDYLHTYHRIDLGLDPFPYNGITTTCDALWMGVPVLTKPGDPSLLAGCLSLLLTAGLRIFVAESEDLYLGSCMDWASNFQDLADVRATLRDRVERSPLADATGFARQMELAYRQIWKRWCGHVTP